MGTPSLEVREHNIILLGSFNPKIFHPQWMARKEVISDGEASGADLKVSHNEISEFELDYCKFQVLPNRFAVFCKQEPYFKKVRDMVLSIFSVLKETPIYKMGLNNHYHYRFENSESWHAFGHKNAPKELWNKILDHPGLHQLTIQSRRTDSYKGLVTVSTGISELIPLSNLGVSIKVNDHYDFDIEIDKSEIDAQFALDTISKNWDASQEKSNMINEEVIKYGCAT